MNIKITDTSKNGYYLLEYNGKKIGIAPNETNARSYERTRR